MRCVVRKRGWSKDSTIYPFFISLAADRTRWVTPKSRDNVTANWIFWWYSGMGLPIDSETGLKLVSDRRTEMWVGFTLGGYFLV